MAKLMCEICGGSLVMNVNNISECENCGMKYAKEKVAQMVKVDGAVEVTKGEVEKERLLNNAYTYNKLNKHKEAEELYVKITQDYPADWNGWLGLGLTRFTLDNNDSELNKHTEEKHKRSVEDAEKQYKTAMMLVDKKTALKISQELEKQKTNNQKTYNEKWQIFLNKIKNPEKLDTNQLPGDFELLQYGPEFCKDFYKRAKELAEKIYEYLPKNSCNKFDGWYVDTKTSIEFTDKCLVNKHPGHYVGLYAVYDDIFLNEKGIYRSKFEFTDENYKQVIDSLKLKRRWFS
ncbi:MAG: hypothetical protein IJ025_00875 [Clostridia bacterium]|nr:hypothetical protein [Clostridia bacterium]